MDTANRKELERVQQLLLDAKTICSVESVSTKIQVALDEAERVLLLPPPPPVLTSNSLGRQAVASSPCLSPAGRLRGASTTGKGESLLNPDQCRIAGDLWKRGSRLRQMIKRHYVLHGNFLYYFAYVHVVVLLVLRSSH